MKNQEIGKEISLENLIEITKAFISANPEISIDKITEELHKSIRLENKENLIKSIVYDNLFIYKIINHFEIGKIEYNNQEKILLKEASLVDKDLNLTKEFKLKLMNIAVFEKGRNTYSFSKIQDFIKNNLRNA